MRTSCRNMKIEKRKPLNLFGTLQETICKMRDYRPMDLHGETWRQNNPGGKFSEWQKQARQCLKNGISYDPGPLDLQAETLSRNVRDGVIVEHVAFNTAPWFRVKGYFLLPEKAKLPVPGLAVIHECGGPMLFGKERLVNTGRDHVALLEHRKNYHSGNYLAHEFCKAGYAVIVIDGFYYGERAPRGMGRIPAEFDPYELNSDYFWDLHGETWNKVGGGEAQLTWAGTTWGGVLFGDDSRCVDYLQSRPEVIPDKIGATGLSIGAWRTNILAALDDRVKAAVSVCWMTSGDEMEHYNLAGAVGGTTTCFPGVWNRMDIPDMSVMTAPNALMVINGSEDAMLPIEGQLEAARQIQAGYDWAGCGEKFRHFYPPKRHCYDAEMQQEAISWFNRNLK